MPLQGFFISRVKGAWVLAWFAAAAAWFVGAFHLSGIWARFGEAQGGETPIWLDVQPFFSVDLAMAAIGNIHTQHAEALAYTSYAIDVPFMLLHAGALASLIAFGVRQARAGGILTTTLFCLPWIRLVADVVENALLSASIAMPAADPTLLQVASVSGGSKAVAAGLCLAAAIGLIGWGVAAKMASRS
jgi:hypothetical protein